jgi:hypothetical protein
MPVESTGHARFLGYVSKGPITIILVKKAFADIGNKEDPQNRHYHSQQPHNRFPT